MYSPQDPYSSPQQMPGGEPYSSPQQMPGTTPYSPQNPYAPQPAPGGAPYTPQGPTPQGPYGQPQQPGGAMPYPPAQGAYQQQYPYLPPQQASLLLKNRRATNAMIYGIISLILSLLTLITLVGFAGLITGTFAIVYGFMGLNLAKRLPNTMGRGQAIVGIVLGFLGWVLVILSFILRSATGG